MIRVRLVELTNQAGSVPKETVVGEVLFSQMPNLPCGALLGGVPIKMLSYRWDLKLTEEAVAVIAVEGFSALIKAPASALDSFKGLRS